MKISAFTVAPRAFSFVNSLLFVNMPCHLTPTRLQSRGLWCFPLLLYASAAARPLPLSLSIVSLSRASAARMRYCCCLCCCCGSEPRARPPARVPCAVARHGRAATSRADVCHFAPLAARLRAAGLARVAPGHASASHGVPQTRPAPPGLVPSRLAAAPFRGATTRHSRRRPNSPRSPLICAPTAQIEHAITLHSIS